ncbi:MAG: TonB-dependent receptor [Acidobacteria bacterium]|nr:TonB-dependent receptor [Acidobacteriota bacterium]
MLRLTVLLSLALLAFAQTDTGVITGLITDASGAAIPGAEVTARSESTSATFRALSNEAGIYVLNALPRGAYEISVSARGFAKAARPGVILNVQSRIAIDFSLKVGDVTETIEVRAETPVLESQTSSVGQVVENKTIVTLPLNGRNYAQLAILAPGATPNPGSRATDGFSINGNRTFQNVFLVDGIDNNNYILGVDTNSTQAMRPSIDAIQEFKLETANYSAEFGRAAGGVISVSIKSGTNEFHVSAFEFLRNDKLDANNFFANRAGRSRPPLRRNQFGATFGGPVWKNHTFFFLSYQGTRVREPRTAGTTVPAGQMAQGIFSTAIYDPLAVAGGVRQQFPDNTIPANRMDPAGRRLTALYPGPNLSGLVNNYTAIISNQDRDDQGDVRADHRLGASDNLFFRYSQTNREINRGSFFSPPGHGGNGFGDYPLIQLPKAFSVVLNETHVFTPAIVNEFRAGYTRNSSDQLTPSPRSLYDEFGIKGVPATPGLTGLPYVILTGFSALGDRTFAPNPKLTQVRQFIDNISWVRGNHALKFGTDIRLLKNFAATSNTARGNFNFNGQFTSRVPGQGAGHSLADMLLGQTSSATLTTFLQGDFRHRYYSFFFHDNWKLSRKLTLNLGLRYEMQTLPWERYNNQGNFDLDPRSASYGQIVRATGDSVRSRTFADRDNNNLAPRAGFAYQLTPKTVIRGATGIFYGGWGYLAIALLGPANLPFFVNIGFPSASTAASSQIVLASGFAAGTLDPNNARNPSAIGVLGNSPFPVVYQWNFGVQRELPAGSVLSVSYVGSASAYLPGVLDINDPPPGAGAVNPRRPFPNFGAVTLNSSFAHSSYQSLQAKLEKRFSRGVSLLSSYTWSHVLDNSQNGEDTSSGPTNPQNPRDTRAERSHAGIDVRQRFVTSFIWELPFRGSGAARWLLREWQAGGIFTASSGVPMNPGLSPNPANTTGPVRPDRVGNGNLPRSERTVDRWYDPSAFAIPASFRYGNSGRNVVIAPGLVNFDALIGRNFPVGEKRRLEFRAEFFNFTNSVHFGRPNLTVNLAQAGRISDTASPNRQVQLGLRFTF